ncbi:nitrite reductase large subunit NirB [Citricoccus sp.]|uniref:nitrite reductase large subunit NirB n=1 Tax=Citricoccus sp. TaxID=1978372 RepID=UPI002B98CCFE|nr:nitrite reductase large subunit NirB [Citricoccus sp.]HRO93274.1 nitrite reductase large subunit NirB [Citricoccus sp.]
MTVRPIRPTNRTVAVVGGGPAAHRLVEALLARGDDLRVSLFTEEPRAPYDRVALSRRFLDATDDLPLGSGSGPWDDPRVSLRTGCRVTAIDPAARSLTTADGSTLGWDDLVLATGSDAARPAIPGAGDLEVYRTIDDVDRLRGRVAELATRLGRPPQTAVIGGGLLGLEAAGGLRALGADVTVVHSRPWVMNAQLDEFGGRTLNRLLRDQGYVLRLGERPSALEGGWLRFPSGEGLPVDLVVAATGITARDELGAGVLQIGPRGGFVIDETCATSAPHVWAIGEAASFGGECMGLVAPANTMAEVVADRLCGGSGTFPGFDTAAKLKLAGLDVASFGDGLAAAPGALEVVYADPTGGVYQKLVVSEDARTLLGGVFVGDAGPYAALRPMLGRELPGEAGAFLSAAGNGAPPDLALPDEAQVCSCRDVSAGDLRRAVCGGCPDLAGLKACTGVGTQCGSCLPAAQKVMERQLVELGVEVSTALCEHFALSRSGLFEAVRSTRLTTFGEIVTRFGTPADPAVNLGCDICKPVAASVLATLHGEYILDGDRGGLQDTNDRALANLQKDGTYSVVPRIPAGEITPEKLAVIAEVARDYGLYTKITGAQRIDLFGATLEQLPPIWRRLVDAGFESGQAYGKALRNVKSCVGSTWCRYGVQDSVAMAVRLEERYRGLRSPHKMKFGVSGCARECAEARGKDVGVIATSEGWNLYVGGNGGATPAHAVLLAKDLDDETLLRYIDRYVVYYIRTAERLQRTARWMEELPGGIDHVQDVVVQDSLGIAADLERVVADHLETYRDEWAATLEDPERLRRFRTFVNAPAGSAEPAGAGSVVLSGPRIPVRGER